MKPTKAASMPLRTLMFRIVAVVIGLASLYFGFQERTRISHLRSAGLSAQVEPIQDYTQHSSRGSDTYTAEFNFTTDQGMKIRRRHSFPEALIADFQNDIPVMVRYDPKDPSEFMFESEEAPIWPYLFGIGFIVAAFVLIRAPAE